jgi:hypothetical protein
VPRLNILSLGPLDSGGAPFVSECLEAFFCRAEFSLGNSKVLKAVQVKLRNFHSFCDNFLNVSAGKVTVESE